MTDNEWESDAESVSEVRARESDTLPAPPPTEPDHEPLHSCQCLMAGAAGTCDVCGLPRIWFESADE